MTFHGRNGRVPPSARPNGENEIVMYFVFPSVLVQAPLKKASSQSLLAKSQYVFLTGHSIQSKPINKSHNILDDEGWCPCWACTPTLPPRCIQPLDLQRWYHRFLPLFALEANGHSKGNSPPSTQTCFCCQLFVAKKLIFCCHTAAASRHDVLTIHNWLCFQNQRLSTLKVVCVPWCDLR